MGETMELSAERLDEYNGRITAYNKPFVLRRADPYVTKASDGTYYMTGSFPEYDRIVLRKADSLKGLTDNLSEKVIWKAHDEGIMSKHIWAPELHFVFGKWYIYFAAGEKNDIWKIRPYVLECNGSDPFNDIWKELGPLKAADNDEFSFKAFSLDSTVFEHNGDTYIIWAEKVGVGRQISNLYIGRLKAADKLDTVQVLLTTPDYDWERAGFWVCEGPAVLKGNGKLFVTYSASATGSCYCMGMLSADEKADLLDRSSWKKERYPVFMTDEEAGIYGPGHNSFTKDEEGADICVFHARTYEKITGDPLYDPNRHAMLMKVEWDNGFPRFLKENIIVF